MAKPRATKAKDKSRRKGGSKDEDRIVQAALDLIAESGWRTLTLEDVARRANLGVDAVRALFPKRDALLQAFFRQIDDQVAAEGTYSPDDPNPTRDRLFDVLMRRFDALNAHRAAMVALMRDLPFDPPAAAKAACRMCRALKETLKIAGLSTRGPLGILRLKGVIAIYLNALRVWLSDETSDLSPTMAALDKGLRAAEVVMAALKGFGARAPGRPNQGTDDSTPRRPARKPSA